VIDNLLLCVGAQKTGTTWLHAQLKDHPQIGFSHVKEVHYFNTIHNGSILLTTRKVEHIKNLIENNRFALEKYLSDLSGGREVNKGIHKLLSPVDDDWYIDLLNTNKVYAADFTPEYALLPKAGFDNIKAVSKNQKIIFIMRDPLERALSAIQYFYKTTGRDINTESNENIINVAKKDFILNMSQYEKTIKNLNESFDVKDVLFLFYENIMESKKDSIDQVVEFLKIDSINIPEKDLNKRVNKSEKYIFNDEVINYLYENLKNTYEYINKHFSNVPETWKKL